MTTRKIPEAWKRKVKTGYPIRSKWIKGYEYAYQRLDSGRDPQTGKVWVKDHHLGAWNPARPKPLMAQLDQTDTDIITAAWKRGEDIGWIQTYLKAVLHDEPAPATIYNYFRAQGITRDKRTTQRAEKRGTTAAMKVERIKRIKAEDQERKARQARARAKARKEMARGKK